MNQYQKISNYLDKHGSISPMEAFRWLGITKLSTRIGEMIKSGKDIEKFWSTTVNRDGEVKRYRRYKWGGNDDCPF